VYSPPGAAQPAGQPPRGQPGLLGRGREALQVGISYLSFRFRLMRPFLQGEPIVLVENGQLIDRNMRRERLTLDDLAEKARMSEIASTDEIKWAVLETNGDISFTKQSAASNGGPLPAGPRGITARILCA
jgi:uncharacterized membrane protein YcaP (DUF421 family)